MSGRHLVDSSGWMEFFNESDRSHLFADAITDIANLIVPVISIYEVVRRVRRDGSEQDVIKVISAMTLGHVVDIDFSISLAAAQYRLPLADSIIYATAQRFDATLWTQDEGFEHLPNVKFFPK